LCIHNTRTHPPTPNTEENTSASSCPLFLLQLMFPMISRPVGPRACFPSEFRLPKEHLCSFRVSPLVEVFEKTGDLPSSAAISTSLFFPLHYHGQNFPARTGNQGRPSVHWPCRPLLSTFHLPILFDAPSSPPGQMKIPPEISPGPLWTGEVGVRCLAYPVAPVAFPPLESSYLRGRSSFEKVLRFFFSASSARSQ